MRSDRFGRLARWGMGALLLLLLQCFAAPQSARAACSNHLVTSQSERRLAYDRLDDLITGGLFTTLADGPRQERPDRPVPRPCSGPGCSSSVPRPVSTAFPGTVGPDQWIALRAVPGPAAASPAPLMPDEPADRPAGHRPSIFHPPPA
ncbi:MAG: hypothetical protein ACYC61_04030 [Isosphaeraceae bacterium]